MTPSMRDDPLFFDDEYESFSSYIDQALEHDIIEQSLTVNLNQVFTRDFAAPASAEALVSAPAQAPAVPQTPGLGKPIIGSEIKTLFPSDMHFICGCANFDPFGHNNILRDEAIKYYENELKIGKKCKPRESTMKVLEVASQKAREHLGDPASRFRIWTASETGVRLKQSNWKERLFEEVTGNEGKLKDRLEWPLRRALDKAQGEKGNPDGEMAKDTLIQATGGSDADVGTLSTLTAKLGVSGPSVKPPPHIPETLFSRANPDKQRAQRPRVEPTPAEPVLKEFVARYSSLEIEGALGRLDRDRGFQPVENWARELYEKFRDNPGDNNCFNLNQDRKTCLTLVYDLVNEWQKHGFSDEFAQSITAIFKVQRLERILGLCLPMDRAQALYKMRGCHDQIYGIPWYSELHLSEDDGFESEEEKGEWMEYLKSHPDSYAPMNKRLFRLLNSPHFGFREKDDFKRWGKPARVPAREQSP